MRPARGRGKPRGGGGPPAPRIRRTPPRRIIGRGPRARGAPGDAVPAAARLCLETPRLRLRRLRLADARFIHGLVNDPAFVRFIGDRGVRTLADARRYLRSGPLASYARHGFGLYHVALHDGTPVGLCGLVKRDALPDADVGFAFVPAARGRGLAGEAAAAVIEHARRDCGLARLAGVTALDNLASMRLLEKLGFAPDGLVRLAPDGPELRLYGRAL